MFHDLTALNLSRFKGPVAPQVLHVTQTAFVLSEEHINKSPLLQNGQFFRCILFGGI